MKPVDMKALVYTGTQEMTYRNEPLPSPRPGDVVMEVAAPCPIRSHEALPDDTWPLSFNFSGGMLL